MKGDFKLSNILKHKNNLKIIIITAFVGIALIALSEFIPEKEQDVYEQDKTDYAFYIEEKITSIVSAITGEKSPKVIVTLESTTEYIYATEKTEKTAQQDTTYTKESEEKFIIIDNQNDEEALIVKEIQPIINGVVVATIYSQNINIKESIINAVTTALNLPSNKVCVVNKIK